MISKLQSATLVTTYKDFRGFYKGIAIAITAISTEFVCILSQNQVLHYNRNCNYNRNLERNKQECTV